MYKRVKTINKYYTNLEYDRNNKKKEALEKISTLSKELNFKNTDNVAHRLFHVASLIEKYLDLFMSVCEHADVITTILDYLYHFGAHMLLNLNNIGKAGIMTVMLTICNIHVEDAIGLFLETAIVPQPQMKIYYNHKKYTQRFIEMIIFEDSDLYAVINCLKITSVMSNLNEIWIQESIVQTFKWHFKKCFGCSDISINIFQSKQDLIIKKNTYDINNCDLMIKVKIVSIWSEDIIAAKNLAESLNEDILFINIHMDFCPGVLFPYIDVYIKSLDKCLNLHQDMNKHIQTYTNPINETMPKNLIYNLFYNGEWQIPIRHTYWTHNNNLLANATREDIMECADSATDGFEIWSTMSSKSRMKILSNFASTLESNGKFLLSGIVTTWIKFSYIYGSLIYYYQNERFEVTKIFKPQGTVVLKEKDEIIMFRELTQSLIIGNSVIVICDPDLCLLAPYCNMFKLCGIPPGVINLLSSKENNFMYNTIDSLALNTICNNFSLMKQIIICCK